jgi:hypothetical protein
MGAFAPPGAVTTRLCLLVEHHDGGVGLDAHSDAGAAVNARAQVARAKCRRGYRDSLV